MSDAVDAILIGEEHIAESTDAEEYIIKEVGAEYVLSEMVEDRDPDETRTFLKEYRHARTLQTLGTYLGERYGEKDTPGKHPEAILERAQELEAEYDTSVGYMPETPEELVSSPVYELHPAAIDAIRESVAAKKASVEDPEERAELDAIEEVYRNYEAFNTSDQELPRNPFRHFDMLQRLQDRGITVRGADIDWDDPSVDQDAYLLSDMPMDEYQRITRKRERTMGRKVAQATEESDGPVVAVLGRNHVAEDSAIHDELEKHGISYRTVNLESDAWEGKGVFDEVSAEDYLREARGDE